MLQIIRPPATARIVPRAPADERALAKLPLPKNDPQPKDYNEVVVMKPWGYEFQVFNNGLVSIWLLCIKPAQETSMHCHPNKKSSFIPLVGELTFHTLSSIENYRWPDTITCEKGAFHAQSNEGDKSIAFLEVETPVNKTDIVRLRDRYGRAQNGYEGIDHMRHHMRLSHENGAGHFFLSEDGWKQRHPYGDYILSIDEDYPVGFHDAMIVTRGFVDSFDGRRFEIGDVTTCARMGGDGYAMSNDCRLFTVMEAH